ncbi:MAG: DNA-3-methyladenine glycosylase [Candidatus Giovannonibacteria bacterium]|nr:DNA-3-methyladenine glycosylase [Candidatus Giovannonibacteria bacterium]
MRRSKLISQKFFNRAAEKVARELLGKFLCRQQLGNRVPKCLMITEVEAYDGFKDKASHAHRGKTTRNFPMFGPAGRWYVYFTYGMHWMLNIVTGPQNYPAAVLIRGVENINGPGRITKFLKINKRFNAKKADKKTGLWIAAPSGRASPRKYGAGKFKIKRASRVGVDYAGKWAKKLLRFTF